MSAVGRDSQALSPRSLVQIIKEPLMTSFIAGGAAGAVSRTVVSPFDRMKIIFQVQQNNKEYPSVIGTLSRMWREEGWRGFFRGNGINVVRVVPYSAVQFATYTLVKRMLGPEGSQHWQGRVLAGMCAGAASVTATYPLDLVRTRLSIQTAQISSSLRRADAKRPPGMWVLLKDMYKNEGGFRSLWRGLVPTTLGVAPYVGINFASYEYFRDTWLKGNTFLAGALSGALAQSITYPFDLLRRRFQVKTLNRGTLGYGYTGTWDALRTIVVKDGWLGLYKGIVPHMLKVVPSMAASFWTYEVVKRGINAL